MIRRHIYFNNDSIVYKTYLLHLKKYINDMPRKAIASNASLGKQLVKSKQKQKGNNQPKRDDVP